MSSHQPLPDDALVVRCGQPPFEGSNALHSRCSEHAGVYGFSVHSAWGVEVEILAARCPNNKIGVTTVGAIRSNGYDVVATLGKNPDHATVVVPRTFDERAARVLGAVFQGRPNPVPKDERSR